MKQKIHQSFNTFKYIFCILAFCLVSVKISAQSNPSPQTIPYTQNFSSFTGNSTTYPAGWQGWKIGTTLNTTYVTSTPLNDIALAGGTNTTTTAGLFDMVGKMGILSTGSNVEAICLAINTSGNSGIKIVFDAATQAQISAGRINELGMQYRVGTSGAFTNISSGTYQNNATSTINSGSTASNIQTFTINLPAACDNQSNVQIRWLIRDVSGNNNRPSFSIDNISVTAPSSQVLITAQDPNYPTSVNWAIGTFTNQIYWAAITPSVSAATLNSVTANMTGSYLAADIPTNGFKLYYSSDATLIPGGDVWLSSQSSTKVGSTENITWSGFSQNFPAGSTGYIYATADIASNSQAGNNLAGSFTGNTNIVFSPAVTYSVSNTYGSTTNKTFVMLPTNPSTFSVSCSSEANIKVSMSVITTGTVLVFANTGTTFTAPTGLGTSFTGANNSYASATNYAAVGGRLVYNGTGGDFTVTGLTGGQTYSLIAYSFNGSNWSSGTSVITGTAITQPVTAVVVAPSSGLIQLSWTNPLASACTNSVIVIARQGSPVEASISKANFDNLVSDPNLLQPNTTWTSNSNANDVYDLTLPQIGTDNTNFIVFNGIGSTVSLNGLTNGTPYYFRIFTVDINGTLAKWSAAVDANGTPGLPGSYWITDGISYSWTSNKWGTSGSGPFSNAWVPGDNVFFTANSTVNFASTTVVGDVIVNPGLAVTVSQAGGTTSGTTVRTYSIGAGSTFSWAGQNLSTSVGFGVIKDGAGTWDMGVQGNAFNTTNGGYKLNAGTVIVGGNNCFGGSLTTFSINGGTIQSSGTRSYGNNSIIIGGDFAHSGTGNAVFTGVVNLGAATRIITNNTTSGSRQYTGIISGGAGSGLAFSGNGGAQLYIGNTGNTFTGPVTINGGEVVFNNNGALASTTSITIDGGRLTMASMNSSGTTADLTAATIGSSKNIFVGNTSGTSISISGATGITTYNGVIADKTSTIGSWAKQGSGVLILGGASIYSGATAINNGTLQLSLGNNRLPITTTLTIGQAASTNLGVLDLNGRNQQIAGLNSILGTNASASKNTVTSASAATLTLGDANNYNYSDGTPANSGIITGAISILKIGAGIQTLGDINSYTGSTQINQGELRFSPKIDENLSSSAVTLNGGTIGTTGITSGKTLSFSTLNLADNSIISLETSSTHSLKFLASNGVSWAASKTVTVTGWQGTFSSGLGTSGTFGKIFVGNSSSGLTTNQLAQIVFLYGADYYPATILSTGEIVPRAEYYWNGGVNTANPANGGTGTWHTANNWRMPTNIGSQTTWVDGFKANFGGTAGVVTLGADVTCTSANFAVNNYTIVPSTSQVITGSINIGAGQTLTYDGVTTADKTLTFHGNVPTGSLTINALATGNQLTRLSMGNNSTTSFTCASPITITGSGFANIATGGNGNCSVLYSGNITGNNKRLTLGATQGYTTTFSGVVSNIGDVRIAAGSNGGGGTIIFSGANTWTGNTLLNNGSSATLKISGNDRLPITTTFIFGETSNNGDGKFDLNSFNQTLAGISNGAQSGGTILNSVVSSTSNLTINGDSSFTTSADLTNGSGILKLTKSGNGVQTLIGNGHTLSGGIVINAGGVCFSPSANINISSCPVTLNSGTLSSIGITVGTAVSFSTIILGNSSVIDLETANSHTLSFANSSSASWTGTLTIKGWQGNYCGTGSGTIGKIFVGGSSSSLTSSQLDQILFFDGTNYYSAKLSTTGELIPDGFPFISVPASSNSPLCSGNTLLLNVTAKGTPSPSYSWAGPNSFTANSQSVSLTNVSSLSSGIYTASATNICGTVTSTVSVTINTTPTLSPISNINICQNKLVNTTFTSTPTGSTFNWSNSNTIIGLTSSGTGSISFTTSIIPSNQTAIVTVTPQLNSCVGLSQSFSITVNGDPSSTIWTGAISNDWFEADNWTNCVCGSSTNATITSVTSPSFNPIISGSTAAYVSKLEINPSASLSVQSTQTLNINGDFINNGSLVSSQGLVSLTGSSIQNISGSNGIDFYDLQLNNSSGATLSNTVGIKGSLYLNAGSLNTNGKLTILAGTTQTGRIAPINSNADITGNVNIQQLAKGGSTGWALLGAPIVSNITMADWNDDFAITCASCPNGSQSGFTSIYAYSETAVGSFSSTSKYVPITSITNTINNGQGYWVYLGNGNTTTTDIVFDVNGTVAKSSCLTCSTSIKIPVSYTNNNPSSDDNGWNLIANPLPSPISWSALRNNNSNVDNAIYAYNTDFLSGSGDFTSYVNGISSDLTGGIGDAIPMCQAFYIHATGTTTLNATENVKTFSNQVLLKNNQLTVKPIVRLIMNGGSVNLTDMTTFYFEAGATNLFEKNYDAYKLINDPTLPYIGSISSNELTSINGLPNFTSNITVPVKAITSSSQTFTFSILKSDFPSTVCINLYDAYTGISTNLSNSNYSCMLYDTTQTNRFTLNFTTLPLSGTTISNQPVCSAPNSGNIIAVGNNSGPWDFEWRDSNNTIVKTSYSKSSADTLTSLSSGNYTIKINTTGQCDLYSSNISINQIVMPFANFTTNTDTIYLSNSTQLLITNNSLNCNTYDWNFGDLTPNDNSINPYHIYTTAGTFSITLITESISNCFDSTKNKIVVINDITNTNDISELEKSYSLFYYQNSSSYCLKINLKENSSIDIKIFDINGQLIIDDKLINVKNKNYIFNLEDKADGIYFLQVNSDRGDVNSFKLKK